MKILEHEYEQFNIKSIEDYSEFVELLERAQSNKRGLFDCYANPSAIKRAIWNEWREWCFDANVRNVSVKSYNTSMFTISGVLYDDFDVPVGVVNITKTKQEIYVPVTFSESNVCFGWSVVTD